MNGRFRGWWSAVGVAMVGFAACAAPRHFPDPRRELDAGRWSRLLDSLGEAPPVPGQELVRLVWQRSFGDDFVITAGLDGDVGFARWRRYEQTTDRWSAPQLVFVDAERVLRVTRHVAIAVGGWAHPGAVADGDGCAFEGASGGAVWSGFRHGPDERWWYVMDEITALVGGEWVPQARDQD